LVEQIYRITYRPVPTDPDSSLAKSRYRGCGHWWRGRPKFTAERALLFCAIGWWSACYGVFDAVKSRE
jgi:hypothetical protein